MWTRRPEEKTLRDLETAVENHRVLMTLHVREEKNPNPWSLPGKFCRFDSESWNSVEGKTTKIEAVIFFGHAITFFTIGTCWIIWGCFRNHLKLPIFLFVIFQPCGRLVGRYDIEQRQQRLEGFVESGAWVTEEPCANGNNTEPHYST